MKKNFGGMIKMLGLGLPKGSLNKEDRGNTSLILRNAGYILKGYEPGKESSEIQFLNDASIEGILVRPQSAPFEVAEGVIDAAIIGSDWVNEWKLSGVDIEKISDFDYGNTRIVLAGKSKQLIDKLCNFSLKLDDDSLTCYTEYVMTAKDYLKSMLGLKRDPIVNIRGIQKGDYGLVQVFASDGLTESYVEKGLADIIIDNTMTGSTLKKYGLIEGQTILNSSAGLYASKEALKDKAKREKLEEIADNINAGIQASKSNYVVFNVRNEDRGKVENFLIENKLFADEPTMSQGTNFCEYGILVQKMYMLYSIKGLRELGARSLIVTEPKLVF